MRQHELYAQPTEMFGAISKTAIDPGGPNPVGIDGLQHHSIFGHKTQWHRGPLVSIVGCAHYILEIPHARHELDLQLWRVVELCHFLVCWQELLVGHGQCVQHHFKSVHLAPVLIDGESRQLETVLAAVHHSGVLTERQSESHVLDYLLELQAVFSKWVREVFRYGAQLSAEVL